MNTSEQVSSHVRQMSLAGSGPRLGVPTPLLAFVVISPIWKHYESCEMKHEMTLLHTMGQNGNVLFQTHLLFMTIYGSLNIR